MQLPSLCAQIGREERMKIPCPLHCATEKYEQSCMVGGKTRKRILIEIQYFVPRSPFYRLKWASSVRCVRVHHWIHGCIREIHYSWKVCIETSLYVADAHWPLIGHEFVLCSVQWLGVTCTLFNMGQCSTIATFLSPILRSSTLMKLYFADSAKKENRAFIASPIQWGN